MDIGFGWSVPKARGECTALEDLCEEAGIEPRLGLTAAQITTLVSLVAAEGRDRARIHVHVTAFGCRVFALAKPCVLKQTVLWSGPFSLACVERFVGFARALASGRALA